MKRFSTSAFLTLLAATVGCEPSGLKSSRGFTLPDGQPEVGQATFVELKCHACHTVSGIALPAIEGQSEQVIVLGGEVGHIQTYGELVTSIINPSHRLASGYSKETVGVEGESKMKNYNDVLTVQQLVDLVAFLQSRYKLKPYEPTDYRMYHYH